MVRSVDNLLMYSVCIELNCPEPLEPQPLLFVPRPANAAAPAVAARTRTRPQRRCQMRPPISNETLIWSCTSPLVPLLRT